MVAWYIIRYPFQRRARKKPVRYSLVDLKERTLLLVATVGLFVVPALHLLLGLGREFNHQTHPGLITAGFVTLLLALWLFRRSHVDLADNWSISLEVREHHRLIQRGVYRLIRHPMYTSFLLLACAQALLIPNSLVAIVGFAAALMLILLRIPREERMMLTEFGEEYRDYMKKTKRLIPWFM